jgi:MFS family permease
MADQDRKQRLFLGCFIALLATAFGFAVRGAVLGDWAAQFGLTEEQKGIISGAGLYPFAISIILFSLIVDRIGYGTSMVIAFVGHVASTLLTIFATSFEALYVATFVFALSNGIVEAVINPVVATVYKDDKTHRFNMLHAGWPGGFVLGGLLSIAVLKAGSSIGTALPGHIWQWQMAVLLLPMLIYGALLFGLRFPVQERVEAGVSYRDMLKEFGWGSAYVVSFLMIMGISQVLAVFQIQPIDWHYALAAAVVPAVLFALYIRSFGRPMFVFLLLVMFLLATTELGTDSWIQDIMGAVLTSKMLGTMFFVYIAALMFVMRFYVSPVVHRISPLGVLAVCSAIVAGGLVWLGTAGASVGILFLAATLYGAGKSFFWPTTLGVVSEQYPRGGALLISAIAGVGMIAVGTLGTTLIGTVQDKDFNQVVEQKDAAVHAKVAETKTGLFTKYQYVDKAKYVELSENERQELDALERTAKQQALAKIAVLPAIMFVCYLGLILYFRSRGGYRAEVLSGHGT